MENQYNKIWTIQDINIWLISPSSAGKLSIVSIGDNAVAHRAEARPLPSQLNTDDVYIDRTQW